MAKKLKTKTQDIRNLSDVDLDKEMESAYRRLFALQLQTVTRQLANHRQLPAARRVIARLKTIKRERQLAAAVEAK